MCFLSLLPFGLPGRRFSGSCVPILPEAFAHFRANHDNRNSSCTALCQVLWQLFAGVNGHSLHSLDDQDLQIAHLHRFEMIETLPWKHRYLIDVGGWIVGKDL